MVSYTVYKRRMSNITMLGSRGTLKRGILAGENFALDFNHKILHILCGFNFAVYRKHFFAELYLLGGRLFFFFFHRLTFLSQNSLRATIETL